MLPKYQMPSKGMTIMGARKCEALLIRSVRELRSRFGIKLATTLATSAAVAIDASVRKISDG